MPAGQADRVAGRNLAVGRNLAAGRDPAAGHNLAAGHRAEVYLRPAASLVLGLEENLAITLPLVAHGTKSGYYHGCTSSPSSVLILLHHPSPTFIISIMYHQQPQWPQQSAGFEVLYEARGDVES